MCVIEEVIQENSIRTQEITEPIVLIGFMGAGKSTVGRELACRSNKRFIDLDFMIERMEGIPIKKIFKEKGEAYFRKKEVELFSTYILHRNTVISCGGGIIENERVRKILENIQTCIWLNVSPETCLSRIQDDSRPLLNNNEHISSAKELYSKRISHYETCASLTINAESKTIKEICHEIEERIKN